MDSKVIYDHLYIELVACTNDICEKLLTTRLMISNGFKEEEVKLCFVH